MNRQSPLVEKDIITISQEDSDIFEYFFLNEKAENNFIFNFLVTCNTSSKLIREVNQQQIAFHIVALPVTHLHEILCGPA